MGKNSDNYFDFLSKLSIPELEELKKQAQEKEDELMDRWAFELNQILNEKGFDSYSKKGERRLNKFNEEHAEILAGALDYIELIDEELTTRDGYKFPKEDNEYTDEDYDKMTTEEF